MIHLNLLRNQFKSSAISVEPETLGSMSTLSFKTVPSRGRKVVLAVAVLVVLASLGTGAWFYMQEDTAESDRMAPPATSVKPTPDTAKKAAALDTSKKTVATRTDTAKKRDSVVLETKKIEPKAPEPPKAAPKPEPKKEAKAEPKPVPVVQPVSVVPQVVAPALAGGVVAQVLSEAQGKNIASAAPTRFEDLSAGMRISYQKFAFERILSVLRQVTGPTVRFNRIKLYSPGVVMLQGTADSASLRALVQGLLAQSMVDTALRTGSEGHFALIARLPFSAGFGGTPAGSDDFARTMLQVRDLATTQSVELAAPKAAVVKMLPAYKRASWKLTGTGSWDSIDKWISALQSVNCPIGFTSLALASGPDGKLRLDAEAISYSK